MEGQGTAPPPGFYDDGTGRQRWWDGAAWTDHWSQGEKTSQPPAVPAEEEEEEEEEEEISTTAIVGYILCILAPFFAFFVGIALIARGDRHGIWVFLLSIATFWTYVFLVLG